MNKEVKISKNIELSKHHAECTSWHKILKINNLTPLLLQAGFRNDYKQNSSIKLCILFWSACMSSTKN